LNVCITLGVHPGIAPAAAEAVGVWTAVGFVLDPLLPQPATTDVAASAASPNATRFTFSPDALGDDSALGP
jgi:hypothetical protein